MGRAKFRTLKAICEPGPGYTVCFNDHCTQERSDPEVFGSEAGGKTMINFSGLRR